MFFGQCWNNNPFNILRSLHCRQRHKMVHNVLHNNFHLCRFLSQIHVSNVAGSIRGRHPWYDPVSYSIMNFIQNDKPLSGQDYALSFIKSYIGLRMSFDIKQAHWCRIFSWLKFKYFFGLLNTWKWEYKWRKKSVVGSLWIIWILISEIFNKRKILYWESVS